MYGGRRAHQHAHRNVTKRPHDLIKNHASRFFDGCWLCLDLLSQPSFETHVLQYGRAPLKLNEKLANENLFSNGTLHTNFRRIGHAIKDEIEFNKIKPIALQDLCHDSPFLLLSRASNVSSIRLRL